MRAAQGHTTLQEESVANETHLSKLMLGVSSWNDWRESSQERPDLSGADLSRFELNNINLNDAFLQLTNFSGASLREADFCRADLYGANFASSGLALADFTDAKMGSTNLQRANFFGAIITGASFTDADITGAKLAGVGWERTRMHGCYLGIRGLDSSLGNPLLKRDIADQNYIDAIGYQWQSGIRKLMFHAWGLIDYGRSLTRIFAIGATLVLLFGLAFDIWHGLLYYGSSANTWFTPFYFSVVTFTTLGFGDVRPASLAGELLTASEVVLGYVTLGLLLAVLAEKIGRRA
jgi:uncharacterized protein YjbI with pentapeptide repeats